MVEKTALPEEAAPAQVRLLGLPLHIHLVSEQHIEELMRELVLVQLEAEQETALDVQAPLTTLSPRLLQLAAELGTELGAELATELGAELGAELGGASAWFPAQPSAVVNAALAAGEDYCDVTYTVSPQIGSGPQRLAQLLEEADDFCCSEEYLLTLPASQEVVAYRRWVAEEFQRQPSGQAARPWHRRLPPAAGAAEPVMAAGPGRAAAPGGAGAPLPPARRDEAVLAGPAEDDEGERKAGAEDAGGKSSGGVVGQPLVMESMASSVAIARRHVRQILRDLQSEALEESAELGVSELVSNAVLHARTSFTLTVRTMTTGRVRIEVDDSSPAPAQPRRFSVAATTGRGLQLVASLSFDWGIEHRPCAQGPGKTVWFEPKELTSTREAVSSFDTSGWGLEWGSQP